MVDVTVRVDTYSEADNSFELMGEVKYRYYVEADKIGRLLTEFFCEKNKFPIYLTFATYENFSEFEKVLKEENQEFEVGYLDDKVLTSTEDGSMLEYNVPVIKAKISDPGAMKKVIGGTFWIAASNPPHVFSNSDNLSFEKESGQNWFGEEVENSVLKIDMGESTTTILISHDAYGFYFFSNEEDYSTISSFISLLPSYCSVKIEE